MRTTTEVQNGNAEHPLGEWLERRYPGYFVDVVLTPFGLFIANIAWEGRESDRSHSLSNVALKMARDAKGYVDYSGETLLAKAGTVPGYPVESPYRLTKMHKRMGGVWDPVRGYMTYPPSHVAPYEPLSKVGFERYEGVL